MVQWPQSQNFRYLKGFLELNGYYRRFVLNYGVIVYQLTKKDAFIWSDQATEAFDKLKKPMVTLPVLTLPYFEKKVVIEADPSRTILGAV